MLSAMSCSIHAGKALSAGEVRKVSLSRPERASSATAAPSTSAGFSVSATPGPQASAIAWAPASKRRISIPARAAGTSPNTESAEYRPPTSGGARKVFLKPRPAARSASGEPASVMAAKRRPGPEPDWPARCQKVLNSDRVSSVVPDLLDTRNRVRAMSMRRSTSSTALGWVLSSTINSG